MHANERAGKKGDGYGQRHGAEVHGYGPLHEPLNGHQRSETTKSSDLRFRAVLTEGDARVLFYHEAYDQVNEAVV